MSHYTDQNPISEQAWMNSVLGQMGLKKSSKYVKENLEIEDKSRQKKEEIIKKFFVKDLTGRGYSTKVEGDRVLALYDEDSFEDSFEEFEDWVESSEVGDEISLSDMRITRIA